MVPCFFFIRVYDDTTIHFRDSGCWRHHSQHFACFPNKNKTQSHCFFNFQVFTTLNFIISSNFDIASWFFIWVKFCRYWMTMEKLSLCNHTFTFIPFIAKHHLNHLIYEVSVLGIDKYVIIEFIQSTSVGQTGQE